MKKFFKYIFVALVFCPIFLGGCKRAQTIPDRELREILKEIYLTNAYFQINPGPGSNPMFDSLDVYRPILKRYGYRISDFEHTMANYTRRKSSNISDVIDRTIKEMEEEESELRYRAGILDTVDIRSQRMLTSVVLDNESRSVRKVADTADLTFNIPVREGIYEVSYIYRIDSTDQNRSLKTTFVLVDTTGKRSTKHTNWMTARRRQTYSVKIDAEHADSLLEIKFGNYPEKDMKTPSLRIDSIRVLYMPTLDKALDSVKRIFYGFDLVIDEF